jgi:hypothetical protein
MLGYAPFVVACVDPRVCPQQSLLQHREVVMTPDTRLTSHDFSARTKPAERRHRTAKAEKAQLAPRAAAQPARPSEDDPFAADHSSDVGKFFGGPTDTVAESHALWAELHAEEQNRPRRALRRGMVWTIAIALLGLLLNGGFLLYHKVWMPTPVELDPQPLPVPRAIEQQNPTDTP